MLSRVSQDLEAMGRPHFGRVRGQLPGSTTKARTATHLSWQHVGAGGVEAAAWCMAAKATWCQQPAASWPQMEAVCSDFAATIRETSRCKRHPGAAPTNSRGPPLRPEQPTWIQVSRCKAVQEKDVGPLAIAGLLQPRGFQATGSQIHVSRLRFNPAANVGNRETPQACCLKFPTFAGRRCCKCALVATLVARREPAHSNMFLFLFGPFTPADSCLVSPLPAQPENNSNRNSNCKL